MHLAKEEHCTLDIDCLDRRNRSWVVVGHFVLPLSDPALDSTCR